MSSLDNITYNKTIFDRKNKQIIENDDKNFSITLTSSNSFRIGGQNNLLSTNYNINNENNNLEDSFIQCVKNIVNYKKKKKNELIINKKEIKKGINNIEKKVNEKTQILIY